MTDNLVTRLRKRAEDERAIQANNEAVATALQGQIEAFKRRDGSHNTFALRLAFEHQKCAKHDAELAEDWTEAADRILRDAEVIEAAKELANLLDSYETAESAAADTASPDDYEFVFEVWEKLKVAHSAFRAASERGDDDQ